MKLHFKVLGEGEPLIILHGLFGSSDNWLSIGKNLAKNFKVFLIDQRNHGQSPHLKPHTYLDMAKDLKSFLVENSIIDPFLIGHSMGGKTIMKFATENLANIKKMVVVDIGPKYYPPHHQNYLKALNSIELNKLKDRQDADNRISTLIPNIGERQFLLKNLFRDNNGVFQWRMNLQLLSQEIENIGEGLTKDLSSNVPTLFLKGTKSNYYINDGDETLIYDIFPNAKIITIKDSGHWVHAEQPDEFLKCVLIFFLDK